MCGIVGYTGHRNATQVLLEGLSKLEYRGYDSAGVAINCPDGVTLSRCIGKLERLASELEQNPIYGCAGIGHTRWATHGIPSDSNAHPHCDCHQRFYVVHNGIIENYLELREMLESAGHLFTSETDTEVLAHLLEDCYQGDLSVAVRAALAQVSGSYALAVICRDHPNMLVAARLHSPLILGHGDGEQFVASDVPALLQYTRRVTYLDNGQFAELTPEGVRITDINGNDCSTEESTIAWDPIMAEKAGYKHFMLKEMYEQPTALAETLRGRLDDERSGVLLPGLKLDQAALRKISRVNIVACGTAYHAGLVGKYAIERLARLPVEIDVASEWRYRNPIFDENTLAVVISQSGETADTLAALRSAKAGGAHILAITNVLGSSVDRESHSVLYTYAGPEIAVASTKAYTTQLMVMYLLALYLAQVRETITLNESARLIGELQKLPDYALETLQQYEKIEEFSRRFHEKQSMLYLGRGCNFPTALEGALKLKEISYIHAEGYAAGEMKHGPIALITPDCPSVAIAVPGVVYEKMLSNIQEVKARRGHVIAIGLEDDPGLRKCADDLIAIPATDELFTPILAVLPLQMLAYCCADFLGLDVDQPRNLAKSVTVE